MSDRVLIDTGFWIALFDPREEHHAAAVDLADLVDALPLVVPWPTLYEVLRTRFVGRPAWVAGLDARLKRGDITFIDDTAYCQDAFSLTVEASLRGKRISMIDMLCRLILDDRPFRIDYLFTVNHKDFYEVCANNGVEMAPRLVRT